MLGIIWSSVDKMIRPIRQCCGEYCHEGKGCEERAVSQYKEKRKIVWRNLYTNPGFIFVIAFGIGFILARLTN